MGREFIEHLRRMDLTKQQKTHIKSQDLELTFPVRWSEKGLLLLLIAVMLIIIITISCISSKYNSEMFTKQSFLFIVGIVSKMQENKV